MQVLAASCNCSTVQCQGCPAQQHSGDEGETGAAASGTQQQLYTVSIAAWYGLDSLLCWPYPNPVLLMRLRTEGVQHLQPYQDDAGCNR